MNVQTTQDLFTRRLGDIHSSACFMARHIPSLVSAAAGENLRKVLNLYLDVVRDNADRTENALGTKIGSSGAREPTAVPAMVDDLFDLIDGVEDPSLIDVAILLSSTEIGSFEAQRLHLLAGVAGLMGQEQAKEDLQKSSERLHTICDQFAELIHDEKPAKRLN